MVHKKTRFDSHLTEIEHNLKLNLWEQYEQKEYLQSWPLYTTIATGRRCNLHCAFCLNRNSPSEAYTDLNLDQFLQFTAPIGKASRIQLYGWGEPLLNTEYRRIFDYVTTKYPGTRIHISTNGTLLTDKWIDRLLAYEKCLINVSINAATAKTYNQITRVNLFNSVVKNISKLVEAKQRNKADDFVITASFVIIKTNIDELPRFVELCAHIGIGYIKLLDLNVRTESQRDLSFENDNSRVRHIISETYKIALDKNVCLDTLIYAPVTYLNQEQIPCNYSNLPIDLHPAWMQVDKILFLPERGECYEPWRNFMVMSGGAVYTCCRGREIMGNISKQSFEEIWNGEKYRAYRRSINTFRPPQACRECPVKTGHALH